MGKNKNSTTISSNSEVSRKITRYQNIDENEIVITETKLENILMKYKEATSQGKDWKTPLSLIITIVLVLLTTEFNKRFLDIDSSAWQLLFYVILICAIIWLIISLYRGWVNKDKDINYLLSLIKNENKGSK